jgi:hypothetical protein
MDSSYQLALTMALILHLPTLKDNPVMRAEVRTQKIAAYLESLENQSIQTSTSSLLRQLVELNRQKVSPKVRVEILDLYRPVVIELTEALAKSYMNTTLPLSGQAKSAANTAEALWLEVGYGYKLAFVDLQNQLIKSAKVSAYCIQRAMQAITEFSLTFYLTYCTPPNHVWSDLHQLYFCAVQLGLQNQSADTESKKTSHQNHTIPATIESTYKQALLAHLADTQHLSPINIKLTTELLATHVNKVHISAVANLDSTVAAFIVNLESNNPPTAYNKQVFAPNPDSDILLLTIDLVKALHQQLSRLQNNQLASEGRDNEIDLLTHLIKHWGISPKRVFKRLAKNGDLELVSGISAIHLSANITSAFNNEAKPLLPSRWQILNISATGLSIRRHPTAEKNIQIGSLIATKNKADSQWSLGVVRWANCGPRDKLDIGVQLIAPHAKSATAYFNKQKDPRQVLSITPNGASKLGPCIVASKGTFVQESTFTIPIDHITQTAKMTKIVDRTQEFEQIEYELIT